MKLLVLFLSFISFIAVGSSTLSKESIEKTQMDFLDSVEKGYQYYGNYETIEFDEFSLLIVKGIYNDSPCYGLSFVSATANSYYLVLETKSSSFTMPKNGNNGSLAIAIKADINYTVSIYDSNDKKVEMKEINLPKFSSNEFNYSSAINGQATGVKFTTLTEFKTRLPFLPVLLITLASLTGFVLLVLGVLFVLKKGYFNKEKRKEGVISMRDIYEAETDDIETDGISFDYEEKKEDYSSADELIPVINPNKREDDEPAISKVDNIKDYLRDKGFFVDYNVLSEEEKNKIMMELIKLKNDGLITLDAYYKETYELWKK